MHIPKASWNDYPPSIEFESTDLPLEIILELAKLSLNQVNVHIQRGDVMTVSGVETTKTDEGDQHTVHLDPRKKPATRVFGPDVVATHNNLIALPERHPGLIAQAKGLARLAQLDNTKTL